MTEDLPAGGGDHEDALAALGRPLLEAMDALAEVGRRLHPPFIAPLVASALPYRDPLAEGLAAVEASDWPPEREQVRDQIVASARTLLEAFDGLARIDPGDPSDAYRFLRKNTLAQEQLYPLTSVLRPISRFFLPAERRDDVALLDRLDAVDPGTPDVGVIHAANERDQRGGFSLYVPEYYDETREWPLVVALHGGSGHGRDFLWTWLKAARAAGAIVLSPTSQERTWSLMGPDVDSDNIAAMIEHLAAQFRVDRSRLLLTGMSDGGTFSTVCGVLDSLPATHLAPIASSFHPSLLDHAPEGRLAGLPVYLVHGRLDWMFPIQIARTARDALQAAGAAVEYREIEDLSHAYPREENLRILEWLMR